MKNGIILDSKDIIKLIAKEYDVDEKDIVKSQYSYFVPQEGDDTDEATR